MREAHHDAVELAIVSHKEVKQVDLDDDATRFRVTLTFDQQSDGKTVVTLRQLHPTKGQRDDGIGFGAVEIGYTTLDSSVRTSRASSAHSNKE